MFQFVGCVRSPGCCCVVPVHVDGVGVSVQSGERRRHLHDVCDDQRREHGDLVVQPRLPVRLHQPVHLRHSQRLYLRHHGHLRDSEGADPHPGRLRKNIGQFCFGFPVGQ